MRQSHVAEPGARRIQSREADSVKAANENRRLFLMQKTGRADMPMNETPFDIEGYYRQNLPPGMSEAQSASPSNGTHVTDAIANAFENAQKQTK